MAARGYRLLGSFSSEKLFEKGIELSVSALLRHALVSKDLSIRAWKARNLNRCAVEKIEAVPAAPKR